MVTTIYLDKVVQLAKVRSVDEPSNCANQAINYNIVRESTTANYVWNYPSRKLGVQPCIGLTRGLTRIALYFDTSEILETTTITSVKLYFVPYVLPLINFDIVIQNGQPDYPSDEGVAGDYNMSLYEGNYGNINTSVLTEEELSYIEFSDVSIITKGGMTKLLLRTSRDIDGDLPTCPEGDDDNAAVGLYFTEDKEMYLVIETLSTPVITTQAAEVPVPVANPAYCEFADGNGTIVSEINATERGFEIKHEVSGTLYNNIDHGMAGFEGDTDWDIDSGWYGTLIKIEHEHGDFEEGAFTLVLGDFPAFAFDKLFAGESYTYRAYAIIDGVKYYEVPEKWVAFSLGTYAGADALPNPGSGDSPFVPIVEPIIEPTTPEVPPFKWPEEVFPPYTEYPPWSYPPFTYPPWEWPGVELPPWQDPTFNWSPEPGIDPSIIFGKTFSAFMRGLDTKKDWETLREKCIIYQENMNQDTLTINHNTTVLKNTVNDIIEYVKGSVYASDLVPMNSCQQLTPLYQEEISPNGFKDIINDFRLKDVNNTYVLNENFMKLVNSLNSLVESDYRIEPISYNASEYIDIEPTAKRMILQLSDMDKKFKEVRRLMALNFKRIFSYI